MRGELLVFAFYLYMFIAWLANLIQLIGCDWASPYKEEVIHAIGLFIFPASMITCWF